MIMLLSVLLLIFYYILINYYKAVVYWKNKGIKYVTPLPIFGNSLPLVLQTTTLQKFIIDLYKKISYGKYGQPILLVTEPELIKRIFIKEFEVFPEHPISANTDGDSLWGKNLFCFFRGKNGRT
ncbi:hypothetical protein NQ317_010960 [Molorchus minor]|uniref:Cytochrome P450 n=1 Tax=Molorchus minor TaxID=1323400 RepID=A0ABQ9JXL3_9CUCU|nr:hypothetical protein NQ317_010960 [Molorchus minor]